MCGIAGIYGYPKIKAQAIVERMTQQQAHRGPDDTGTFCNDIVALGHRRLAIIDLSPNGHQPMWSVDRRYAIVFNGEIYNFQMLRRELEAKGLTFRSHTDTEVIIEAYRVYGERCVEHLNGMFAFAIYDCENSSLFIARDRLGIKPLYYYQPKPNQLLFASEMRALLISEQIPRQLNHAAIADYLAQQTVPTPATIIQDIHLLQPGHFITLDQNGLLVKQYWHQLADANPSIPNQNDDRIIQQIRTLLREAVERRLISDVPLGAFLSGGIDSSAIVGLMCETGKRPVQTFSVIFDEDEFSEAAYARRVATHFNTEHTEIHLTGNDLLAQLPQALEAMDHPSGDGINTYIVSKAVRQAGIKVALSGLGGDEFFCGYPSFRRLAWQQKIRPLWYLTPSPIRHLAATGFGKFGRSMGTYRLAQLLETDGSIAASWPINRSVFSSSQRHALLSGIPANQGAYVSFLDESYRTYPGHSLLNRISYAEARAYMHDVLLRDTDQMSMAHALEVRVPLLDHKLVEYVMSVPDRLKQTNGTPKRLLVKALNNLLPAEIIYRKKRGFKLPFTIWMRNELGQFCEEQINALADSPIFDARIVRSMWQAFLNHDPTVSWKQLWILVVLQHYCQKNGISLR